MGYPPYQGLSGSCQQPHVHLRVNGFSQVRQSQPYLLEEFAWEDSTAQTGSGETLFHVCPSPVPACCPCQVTYQESCPCVCIAKVTVYTPASFRMLNLWTFLGHHGPRSLRPSIKSRAIKAPLVGLPGPSLSAVNLCLETSAGRHLKRSNLPEALVPRELHLWDSGDIPQKSQYPLTKGLPMPPEISVSHVCET